MARHPRREIAGRAFEGTPCLELLTLDGGRPVVLNRKGYAQVYDGQGGMVCAHRVALAIETGRDYWTEPLDADHLCHTRNCVNPAHLKWEPHEVNTSRERTTPEGTEARSANGRIYGRAHADATRIAVVSKRLDTGELCYHRDQHTAARELGLDVRHISACVRGKRLREGRYAFARYDPTNSTHDTLKEQS